MSVPGDFQFSRDAATFDPTPPGLDSNADGPQHFQTHENGEWEREPSAEDGYSEWFREHQEKEASNTRSRAVVSPPPPAISDFMMPMATMMAEAMNSAGFGEKSVREVDSVKVPGFARWRNSPSGSMRFCRT